MATRTRTTKAPSVDVTVDEETPSVQEVLDSIVDVETPAEPVVVTTSSRKYFSHENCEHARKGDAGKAARAACRRSIRSWIAAKEEWEASLKVDEASVAS